MYQEIYIIKHLVRTCGCSPCLHFSADFKIEHMYGLPMLPHMFKNYEGANRIRNKKVFSISTVYLYNVSLSHMCVCPICESVPYVCLSHMCVCPICVSVPHVCLSHYLLHMCVCPKETTSG